MKDITLINHLNSMAPSRPEQPGSANTGFSEMLKAAIDDTGKQLTAADQAMAKLGTGEAKNIHEVMITMEKADISMRLLVQMRNKVVEAYNEVMRMQV